MKNKNSDETHPPNQLWQTEPLTPDKLEFNDPPLTFDDPPLELDETPLELDTPPLELDETPLDLDTKPMEFDNVPLELEPSSPLPSPDRLTENDF